MAIESSPAQARRLPRGFTLIELLVVVAVLSATALLALAVVTHDQGDLRHGDTAQRLKILRQGVLGLSSPAWDGQMRLSGFVADNGRLPRSLNEIVNGKFDGAATAALAPYGTYYFPDAAITTPCSESGVPAEASGPSSHALQKGWRGGYLGANDGAFRDGWSNRGATDDSANFGWLVQTGAASDAMNLISLGANDAADAPAGGYPLPITDAAAAFPATTPPENADQGIGIGPADWQTDVGGWRITVVNRRTGTAPASGDLQTAQFDVRLLVARSDADGVKWVAASPATAGSDLDGSCLDANGDGVLNPDTPPPIPVPCVKSATLTLAFDSTLPAICNGRIPYGRHLLLLRWSGTDANDAAVGPADVIQPIAFYAGTGNPAVTLELR